MRTATSKPHRDAERGRFNESATVVARPSPRPARPSWDRRRRCMCLVVQREGENGMLRSIVGVLV